MDDDTWDSHPAEEAWTEPSEAGPARPPIGVCFVGSFEGRSLITLALRGMGGTGTQRTACWFTGEIAALLGLGGASDLARRLAIDWADQAREGVHWLRVGELELAELQLALLDRGVVLPPSLEQARSSLLLLEPGLALAIERAATHGAGCGERLISHIRERIIPDMQALGRPSAAPYEHEAAAIVRERIELERRRWEFDTLDRLAEQLELEGEVDGEVVWAYRVVAAEVALDGDLWQLKPTIEHGWLSPTEVARRHLGVTPARVGQVISLLGLRESRAHSKAVLNKAPGRERSVITHLYSPAAVGLIERELRSRGYRRVE
jgi:DNA-binding transcriptional regulator YdaS (Cro superfamily)